MGRFCGECSASIVDGTSSACPWCGSERTAEVWPEDRRLGEIVVGGQYRVLRRLGAGGFGVVYEVETVVGGLRRALKVLDPRWAGDEDVKARFINEALVLEEINHPNVARCYAVGTLDSGEPYLLLELISGRSLKAILGSEHGTGFETRRAVRLAKQIAAGLVAAHGKGVLHRDLKPENVLVQSPGSTEEQAKIIDFGVAKIKEAGFASTQNLVGTPNFMAPEQFNPGTPLDDRVDLYQLGALLFTLLTGQPPYRIEEGGLLELVELQASSREAGPRPSEHRSELRNDPELDDLVATLLATDRDRRPASAREVCERLARIEQPLVATSPVATARALVEALAVVPCESGWWALVRFLEGQSESDQSNLVDVAETALEGWPAELRVASIGWWERIRRGQEAPLWRMVRALDLSGRDLDDADAEALSRTPAVSNLRWLSLANNQIGSEGTSQIASSPHLGELRVLDLSRNRITSTGFERLIQSEALRSLESLSLSGNAIGERGASTLRSAVIPLKDLDLSSNELGANGAAAFAGAEALSGLERLTLADNAIGSDGAAALAVGVSFPELVYLDLTLNELGPSGAAALALSTSLGGLQHLRLGKNALGREGLQFLLSSSKLQSIEHLDLSSNGLGPAGAMLLASSNLARRLRTLDLSDDALGDAGFATLLGASQLAGLRRLRVAQNEITASGIGLLAGALPQLEALDVSRNPLAEAGARALAEALCGMNVGSLAVAGAQLTAEGLASIISASGGRLHELTAADNSLGFDGASRLAGIRELGSVERLDLSSCDLGPQGAQTILQSENVSSLEELVVATNGLGDACLVDLVTSGGGPPRLKRLSLADNQLGPAAGTTLAASALAGRLEQLDLSYNELGDTGVEALAHATGWHALRSLMLRNNALSLGGIAALLASRSFPQLSRVDLSHNVVLGSVDIHSLGVRRVGLLERTFPLIAQKKDETAERFYQELFSRYPNVKSLFSGVSMVRQRQHLMASLTMIIDNLRDPDMVRENLLALGARHVAYGVVPSYYYAVNAVLLDVIRQAVGSDWNEDVEDAWREGLDAISNVMMSARPGAGAPQSSSPRSQEKGVATIRDKPL